jgi:LPXTG-site transpeptidase (sortase) family protein
LGLGLIAAGIGLVVATLLPIVGLAPWGRVSVPPPEVLQEPTVARPAVAPVMLEAPPTPAAPRARGPEAVASPQASLASPTVAALPSPTATSPPRAVLSLQDWFGSRARSSAPPLTPEPTRPTVTPSPTPVPPPPAPGLPVRLVIPSIRVDTNVVELDVTVDDEGELHWDTVPFVAGHYALTGMVGAPTNVVLSGHVATRDLGNVFRDLYRLRPGDPLIVHTSDGEFTYRVSELRLVKPWEVDVVAASSTPRLTLVTCAGRYDFLARDFTERLIVGADLVLPPAAQGARLS